MRWDGSTFVSEPIPDLSHLGSQPTLESVALATGGEPWVVGGLVDSVNGKDLPLILRWSAGLWQTYPVTYVSSFVARYPRLVDVASAGADNAWTIGRAEGVSHAVEPFAAHWDGSAWTEVAFPGTTDNRYLTAVSAARDAVFAVGYDAVALGARNTTFARVYRFKGGEWSVIDTPAATKAGSVLNDVVVLSVNDVWVVGTVGSTGLFLHWDGATWSTVEGPASADPRSVSAVVGDDVWAAGSQGHYRWNGKSWSFVSAPSDPGIGARRMVAVASSCDVWSVAVKPSATGAKSEIERFSNSTPAPQPPPAPAGLTATVKGPKQVVIEWSSGASDPTGPVPQDAFVIERCIGDANGCLTRFAPIAKVSGNEMQYVDTDVAPKTSYAYRVFAVNAGGASEATAPVAAVTLPDGDGEPSGDTVPVPVPPTLGGTTPQTTADTVPQTTADTLPLPPFGPPAAPTNLSVKTGSRAVELSWIPGNDPGPAGRGLFVIDRCIGVAGDCVTRFVTIQKVPSTVTKYLDSGLQPASKYSYRVYAVNDAGVSDVPPAVTATTLPAETVSRTTPPAVTPSPVSEPIIGGGVVINAPQGADAPATPVGLVAKGQSSKKINLYWQSGGDPTMPVGQDWFVIERCVAEGGSCVARFSILAKVGGTVTTYADTAVRPGTTYAYRIQAVSAAGKSDPTAPETASTLPADTSSPGTPTGRTAVSK
jgi:hypothetical protein